MAKLGKTFEETREALRVELERADSEIRDLEGELKVKNEQARALRKAFVVLGGVSDSGVSDVVTMESVTKVIVEVFGDLNEMPEEGLRTRVMDRMKGDSAVNQHGLGLRISQAMKRLERSPGGLVIRPSQD